MNRATCGIFATVIGVFLAAPAVSCRAAEPRYAAEYVFPPDRLHNHSSSIVECPNGDLLICWYHGSGERNADDVIVEGARLRKGDAKWSERFLLADTPGFPDTNPCLFIDPRGRLWLIWQTIIANEWHTALTKYKISSHYTNDGPPQWDTAETLLLKPGPEFTEAIRRQLDIDEPKIGALPADRQDRARAYLAAVRERAGDKYFMRMGWMTRVHPLALDDRRLIIPLYSDGYSVSLMALSDDGGDTWSASAPLVGYGAVQPSVVKRKDGSLIAYMRDNGPPPKRVLVSESKDSGKTWGPVTDSDIPNPGSSVETIVLSSGRWLMVLNDTEQGRHLLSVWLSDDEGKTWKWKRPLESAEPGPEATSASYPSVIQSRDGTIHVTYSLALKGKDVPQVESGRKQLETIKHARFNEAWATSH
jgi:predicted neuraminidase